MLSVLIPIYNWDCRKLVQDLSDQCTQQNIEYEILCFDDGSTYEFKEYNREVNTIMNVSYVELKKNVGRSAIRNRLGKYARFENLLFLDCDSSLVSEQFISNYLHALKSNSVVYGGTCYQEMAPESNRILRWTYGRSRENLNAIVRNRRGNDYFMTNNFAIKRELFLDIQFDVSIQGYGYEDSVFAFELERSNVPIFHIDNCVQHDGLDENQVYLNKVKHSLKNLVLLREDHLVRSTKITRIYDKLQFIKLDRIVFKILSSFQYKMHRNLIGSNPSLKIFDLWKLLQYAKVYEERNTHKSSL